MNICLWVEGRQNKKTCQIELTWQALKDTLIVVRIATEGGSTQLTLLPTLGCHRSLGSSLSLTFNLLTQLHNHLLNGCGKGGQIV